MKSLSYEFTRGYNHSFWSVVLAAGNNIGTQPWIRSSPDLPMPGNQPPPFRNESLFRRTAERARRIRPEGNIIAVTLNDYERALRAEYSDNSMHFLVQPSDKRTAPAIYLALSHIAAYDKHACVVVYPSNHYVYPESDFIGSMRRAADISGLIPHKILLIGATPEESDPGHSWIIPGPKIARFGGNRLSYVATVRERTEIDEVRMLTDAGGLWNTQIMIGNIDAFWEAGEECYPHMMESFNCYRTAIGSSDEISALKTLYEKILPCSFGHNIVPHIPQRLASFQLNGVYWSNWEKPGRIPISLMRTEGAVPPQLFCNHKSAFFPQDTRMTKFEDI